MKATFAYTGIRVKNLEKSIEFYTQVLGMKETGRNRIEAAKGEVVSLSNEKGAHELELNYYEKGSKFDTDYSTGEALDHLAFRVDDLDNALAEAKRLGYPTVLEMKGQTSRWAYIEDPNGIQVEIFA